MPSSGARRDIPIVFTTGHGDVSTAVRAMKGGAVDFLEKPFRAPDLLAYLQKPFREDALIAAIQQALEGRRA